MTLSHLAQDDYLLFFKAHVLRDEATLIRRSFFPELLDIPRLSLDELVYVDHISLKIVEVYERLEIHHHHLNTLCETKEDDTFNRALDSMKSNVQVISKASAEISIYAGKRLGEIGYTTVMS